MQKSAHTNLPSQTRRAQAQEPQLDKGQKFEPFWNNAFGLDRRSRARQLKADQKR
jgi:hypothetical protein